MSKAYVMKNLEAYYEIIKKALDNGKKPGDYMTEEFEQVAKEHPEWFELIGECDTDVDKLTGELREKGVKVFNIHEVDRKAEHDKKDKETSI